MKLENYKKDREVLYNAAEKLLKKGDLEGAEQKMAEMEALDDEYDKIALAITNFRAIQKSSKYTDVTKIGGNFEGGTVVARFDPNEGTTYNDDYEKGVENMKNRVEVQAFQNYIAAGGDIRTMHPDLRDAISTSGAGAVLPVDIFQKVISDEKYSDILHRATIINQGSAGTIKIPIMNSHSATWKAENTAVTPSDPTMTSIDLGGKELMRAIQYSAAVDHMSVENFSEMIAGLVASETVETLEKSFISGNTGSGEPHNGLEFLTWDTTNSVIAEKEITAGDVAKGLSILPQKYSRNAILLMNASTSYSTVGLFKGTSEYAYSVSDGATKFMGKEIIINEHCKDNEIYIVDPKELYVRFSMMPRVEVDRSSGFLSATTSMRCLTVVDFAWNTTACVKVAAV